MAQSSITQGQIAESDELLDRVPVTVAVPHWRGLAYLPPCVRSALRQSASNPLTVVVYNDDERSTESGVRARLGALLKDPRVVLFTAGSNRGPYFAREVVRRASRDPLYATLDADDFVDRFWLERLVSCFRQPGVIAATPRLDTFITRAICEQLDAAGTRTSAGERFGVAIYDGDPRTRPYYRPRAPLSQEFVLRAHMLGVFDAEHVGSIGGFYGGATTVWDRLITNLLLMIGTVVIEDQARYIRRLRAGSLSTSARTGHGSRHDHELLQTAEEIYLHCLELCEQQHAGRITRSELHVAIRTVASQGVSPRDNDELDATAEQLRAVITARP